MTRELPPQGRGTPEEQIAQDVAKALDCLRGIGAIDG